MTNKFNDKNLFMVIVLLLCISVSSCSKEELDFIDPENKKLINTKPILEMSVEGDSGFVKIPESLAIKFVEILEKFNLQQNVKACAAEKGYAAMLKKPEKCLNYDVLDADCADREGYWKGYLNTQLLTKTLDLNRDNIPDYIVSGDSCTGFTHNASADYFVFLSKGANDFSLALTTSAGFIKVLPVNKDGEYLIIDGTDKFSGDSVDFWKLNKNIYIHTGCYYKNHSDKIQEYRKSVCFEQPL